MDAEFEKIKDDILQIELNVLEKELTPVAAQEKILDIMHNHTYQILMDAVAGGIITERTVKSIYNIQLGISAGWSKHTKL